MAHDSAGSLAVTESELSAINHVTVVLGGNYNMAGKTTIRCDPHSRDKINKIMTTTLSTSMLLVNILSGIRLIKMDRVASKSNEKLCKNTHFIFAKKFPKYLLKLLYKCII